MVSAEKIVVKTRALPASSPSLSICWAIAKEATAQGVMVMAIMDASGMPPNSNQDGSAEGEERRNEKTTHNTEGHFLDFLNSSGKLKEAPRTTKATGVVQAAS